jgi:proteasome accessory factor C
VSGGRGPAEERLERVLYLLPAAAREGGAELADLAAALDVAERDLILDLQEVTTRAHYQGPGMADHLQIAIEEGRVSVWTAGEFRRPVKLTPREAVALALGLRAHAIAADAGESGGPRRHLDLARRLERELAVSGADGLEELLALEDGAPAAREDGVQEALFRAARHRRRCRIRYLKPSADGPQWRLVEPYVMAYADGHWYAVSRCHRVDGVRCFRLDRTLEVELTGEAFTVPDGFDPARYLQDGRVYRGHDDREVTVRYSSRVAPWIRERGPVEERDDGSVEVTYDVSDPDWVVRHVLQYGADARVVDPPAVRERVSEEARRITT